VRRAVGARVGVSSLHTRGGGGGRPSVAGLGEQLEAMWVAAGACIGASNGGGGLAARGQAASACMNSVHARVGRRLVAASVSFALSFFDLCSFYSCFLIDQRRRTTKWSRSL
jgi:hypothetical protein